MKLTSMTSYCLETIKEETSKMQMGGVAKALSKINRYAQFLSQPLKLEMFIPVDEEANVLREKKYIDNTDAFFKYGVALEKVLFKGFKITQSENGYYYSSRIENKVASVFWEDKTTKHWELSKGLKTIEDLVKLELELTQTAINKLS